MRSLNFSLGHSSLLCPFSPQVKQRPSVISFLRFETSSLHWAALCTKGELANDKISQQDTHATRCLSQAATTSTHGLVKILFQNLPVTAFVAIITHILVTSSAPRTPPFNRTTSTISFSRPVFIAFTICTSLFYNKSFSFMG